MAHAEAAGAAAAVIVSDADEWMPMGEDGAHNPAIPSAHLPSSAGAALRAALARSGSRGASGELRLLPAQAGMAPVGKEGVCSSAEGAGDVGMEGVSEVSGSWVVETGLESSGVGREGEGGSCGNGGDAGEDGCAAEGFDGQNAAGGQEQEIETEPQGGSEGKMQGREAELPGEAQGISAVPVAGAPDSGVQVGLSPSGLFLMRDPLQASRLCCQASSDVACRAVGPAHGPEGSCQWSKC